MKKNLVKTLLVQSEPYRVEYLCNNLITLPVWSNNLYSDNETVTCFKEVQLLKWFEDHYVTVAYDCYVPYAEVDDLINLIAEVNDRVGFALFSLNI